MEFRLPELGEGVYEAELVRWLVTPGTAVNALTIGSYDFTPQPHKSVSVAWAFAGPVERATASTLTVTACCEMSRPRDN